jgi:hypothetical protein
MDDFLTLIHDCHRNAGVRVFNALRLDYCQIMFRITSLPLPIDRDHKPFHLYVLPELATCIVVLPY